MNLFRSVGALALALALSPLARATPVLDFNVGPPTSGTISYVSGFNPLVGTNITVDTVAGVNSPAHDGTIVDLLGGLLNFTTGNLLSTTIDSGTGQVSEYKFGPGGSITITGLADIDGSGTSTAGDADGTLLWGSFDSASVMVIPGMGLRVSLAGFHNEVDPTLADYYGLLSPSITGWHGGLNLSFLVAPGASQDTGFQSTQVLSGDISAMPVPEPSSAVLLGTSLLGLAALGRRKVLLGRRGTA